MDRFDYIDPRIFLVLPEHVSNAHHIWNCALFLTQLSHLDANSSNPKNAYQADSLKLNSYLKSIAKPNTRKLDEEYFDYSNNKSSSSSLSSKLNQSHGDEALQNLNEPIMKIFKIKKRNKASLFNLILPFGHSQNATKDYSCYYENRNIINDIFNYKLFSNNLTTTPWMQLAVAPPQAEGAQTQISLESNKTLRLEDEEYNDDETDSNDTEELESENSGNQAISLSKIQDSSKRNDLLDDEDGKKDASSASSSSSGSSSNENEDMNARTLSNSANVSNLDFNEGCKR